MLCARRNDFFRALFFAYFAVINYQMLDIDPPGPVDGPLRRRLVAEVIAPRTRPVATDSRTTVTVERSPADTVDRRTHGNIVGMHALFVTSGVAYDRAGEIVVERRCGLARSFRGGG